MNAYDVVVLGGGTAGVVAAIQAARAGARTLLVEKTGMLGGTITMGGVNYPGLFHAWGRQVIAGIGWELVERTVAEAGGELPRFDYVPGTWWSQQVLVNAPLFAALCDEAVVSAGADLRFHTMVAGVRARDDGWEITLCTKTGLESVTANVVIDATGDATAAALAGLPLRVPEETQPATLCCHATGYELEALDTEAINAAYEAAVQRGELVYTDASWNLQAANVGHWLRKHGNNANHIHHINGRDSVGRTQLELEGRKSLLRLYRFLRTQPGLEGLTIESVSPECGVRETVTIIGEATVTLEDYLSGRVWDDAVCYSYYYIDLHVSSGNGIQGQKIPEGVVPTIPRGALVPAGSRNFLVAGRCISSDRLANSALRVQATAMAIGQAAGALAALATRTRTVAAQVPIADLHHLLRTHGAIVPECRNSAS